MQTPLRAKQCLKIFFLVQTCRFLKDQLSIVKGETPETQLFN